MNGLHGQWERGQFVAFSGAWWWRWGAGLLASVNGADDGFVSITLMIGPFYVGVGLYG
jgi:hypothetical protein